MDITAIGEILIDMTQTGATAGNLSVQLDKLARAGYIDVEKTFRGKMPCTVCRITDAGRDAFAQYVEALKKHFRRVYTRKPAASRDTSAEVYLVARERKA